MCHICCRNLPCGVATVNPAFNTPSKTSPDDDMLYSVNQRYAYTDPRNTKKKNVQIPTKYKNNKMTVRLRPRQVLCSKCKGICNENSENVSRKRKSSESVQLVPPIKRGANAPVTRSVYSELSNKKKDMNCSLVPRLARLMSQDITNALSGNVNKLNIIDNVKKLSPLSNNNIKCGSTINSDADTENTPAEQIVHSMDHSDSTTTIDEVGEHPPEITSKSIKRILRKKPSAGSMEDLWDESVLEENVHKNNNLNTQSNANSDHPQNICTSTRTIKISYGPQGEGTILKIPAQIESLTNETEESVNLGDEKSKIKEVNDKAARRALKKAKKEAKRKFLLAGNSPCYLGNGSPRYSVAGSSPRYTVGSASPRHGLGNNSPRYAPTVVYELNAPRRRKHKVKHKKKHREDKDRKHKESEVSNNLYVIHRDKIKSWVKIHCNVSKFVCLFIIVISKDMTKYCCSLSSTH